MATVTCCCALKGGCAKTVWSYKGIARPQTQENQHHNTRQREGERKRKPQRERDGHRHTATHTDHSNRRQREHFRPMGSSQPLAQASTHPPIGGGYPPTHPPTHPTDDIPSRKIYKILPPPWRAQKMHRIKIHRWRPYRVEYTGSLLTSEVKPHRARLVLGWGTAREHLRVLPAFS